MEHRYKPMENHSYGNMKITHQKHNYNYEKDYS